MKALAEQISDIDGVNIYGRVVGVRGLMVEIAGPIHAMSVGARIVIETGGNRFIPSEVIGFSGNNAVVMPVRRTRRGPARLSRRDRQCRQPGAALAVMARRVINAMGEPIDGKGPLPSGPSPMPFRNSPPPAHSRKRVGKPLDLGVRGAQYLSDLLPRPAARHLRRLRRRQIGVAVDAGAQCRRRHHGDRLVGERGREVQEFLQDDLGDAGLARSVVVVATSDDPL